MAKAKAEKAEKANPAVETPERMTTVRATFSGFMTAFGLMTVPVKSYKATDKDGIERHTYHSADCLSRIKQNTNVVCSGCGAEVDKAATVKGVEVDGKVVLVTDEEMKAQQSAAETTINVFEYVPADGINPIYYESSEYLACAADSKLMQEVFANFREGLALSGRAAIGRIISRGHEYFVAIRPEGQHGLVMSYLFAEYEVRQCTKWTPIAATAAAQMFAGLMAEGEQAKDEFTPAAYDSTLRNQRAMIMAKANGTACPAQKAEEPAETVSDLEAQLAAMLAAAKAKKQQKAKAATA